jgi:hypothetical protein
MNQSRIITPEGSRAAAWPADMQDQDGFPATAARQALEFVEGYAREKPISMALWALGIGFVLGWKLKPW